MKRFLSLVPVVCILLGCIFPVSASQPLSPSDIPDATLSLRLLYAEEGAPSSPWNYTFSVPRSEDPEDWHSITDGWEHLSSGNGFSLAFLGYPLVNQGQLTGVTRFYFSLYYLFNMPLSYYRAGSSVPVSAATYIAQFGKGTGVYGLVGYTRPTSGAADYSFDYAVTSFNPVPPSIQSSLYPSIGLSVKGTVTNASELVRLVFTPASGSVVYVCGPEDSSDFTVTVHIPDFSLVAFESDEIADKLDAIAETLIEQNSILSGMQGAIVNVLNNIYTRTGSILTAQNLTNTRLSTLISSLSRVENDVSDIYALLGVYLKYLADIAISADNIEDEVSSFHADFIDRLDQIIDAINNGVPGTGDTNDKINDAQTAINDFDQLEQSYVSSLNSSFDAIDFGTTFDGGFVDGLTLYRGLFMEFWDALGGYAILYTIPLILGIAFLVVGRVSVFVPSEPRESKK